MATFKGITLPNGETYLPEGGGSSNIRLITDMTTTEDLQKIVITEDSMGSPINLKRIYGIFLLKSSSSNASNMIVWVYLGQTSAGYRTIVNLVGVNTTDRPIQFEVTGLPGFICGYCNTTNIFTPYITSEENIKHISFVNKTDGNTIPAGTRLVIYGEDA